MREIKFRAWDTRKNEWLSSDEIMERVLVNPSWEGKTFQLDEKSEKGFAKNIGHSFELMQFTGMKDKNGKEIYEGDIIDYSEVYWSTEWAMYAIRGLYLGALSKYASIYEVMGNQYENPELLTGGKTP